MTTDKTTLLDELFEGMGNLWDKNPMRFLSIILTIFMAFWSVWSLPLIFILLLLQSEKLGIGSKYIFFAFYFLLGGISFYFVYKVYVAYVLDPDLYISNYYYELAKSKQVNFFSLIFNNNWEELKAIYSLNTPDILQSIKTYGYPLVWLNVFWVTCIYMIFLSVKTPYQKEMRKLQKGKISRQKSKQNLTNIYQKKITRKTKPMPFDRDNKVQNSNQFYNIEKLTGKGIGLDISTRKPLVVSDEYLNQVILCLGTTGSGKTFTMSYFYYKAIFNNEPTILVDGKPDIEKIRRLKSYAKSKGVPFYTFGCDEFCSYDFLNHGTPTEIKDKIISLKNEDDWDSDYYRSQAETYLQTAIEVIKTTHERITLDLLIYSLDSDFMVNQLRKIDDEILRKKITRVMDIEKKDLQGIQNQLTMLYNSDLGSYINGYGVSLRDIVKEKAVIYFALNKLKYQVFSTVFGKVVINDIKTLLAENEENPVKINLFFDEFSAFAGEQVLNLVNMGRGYGAHTVLGTQGLADLGKIKDQLLNNANSIMAHRLNGNDAEEISKWVGTKDGYNLTAQIETSQISGISGGGMGSVRKVKEFHFHPDEIKELPTGTFIFCSKVNGIERKKIQSFNLFT